jgi:hypothetical protein
MPIKTNANDQITNTHNEFIDPPGGPTVGVREWHTNEKNDGSRWVHQETSAVTNEEYLLEQHSQFVITENHFGSTGKGTFTFLDGRPEASNQHAFNLNDNIRNEIQISKTAEGGIEVTHVHERVSDFDL